MTPEMLIPEATKALITGIGAGIGFYLYLRLTRRPMPRGPLLPAIAVGFLAALLSFGLGLFSAGGPT